MCSIYQYQSPPLLSALKPKEPLHDLPLKGDIPLPMSCTNKAELVLLTVFLCGAYLIKNNTNQAWKE